MDQIVEQVCAAVRKSDYAEVRRILETLAGFKQDSRVIASNDDQPDRIARLRKQFEEDDAA